MKGGHVTADVTEERQDWHERSSEMAGESWGAGYGERTACVAVGVGWREKRWWEGVRGQGTKSAVHHWWYHVVGWELGVGISLLLLSQAWSDTCIWQDFSDTVDLLRTVPSSSRWYPCFQIMIDPNVPGNIIHKESRHRSCESSF